MHIAQLIKRKKSFMIGLLILTLLLTFSANSLLGQTGGQTGGQNGGQNGIRTDNQAGGQNGTQAGEQTGSGPQTIRFIINNSGLMNVPFEVKQNYTLIPLQHFAQVTGTTQVQSLTEQATLTKGSQTLILTTGQTKMAGPNGSLQAPVSPIIKDGLMYVPLRFLCEQFNIPIQWDESSKTISINLDNNTRQGMTAAGLLAKAQEISDGLVSYQVESQVDATLYQADNTVLSAIHVDGKEMVQNDPYIVHLIQTTKDKLKGTVTDNQFLVTDQQLYSKEGDKPWLAASVNVNSLLRNRQKVAALSLGDVATASELNPVYTFADDALYKDQPCYVIKLYYSPAIYQENLAEFTSMLSSLKADEDIQELFSGLSIEKFQTIYINKDTLHQVGTEVFEETELQIQGDIKPYARLHTEGELVFLPKAFVLPEGLPALMY